MRTSTANYLRWMLPHSKSHRAFVPVTTFLQHLLQSFRHPPSCRWQCFWHPEMVVNASAESPIIATESSHSPHAPRSAPSASRRERLAPNPCVRRSNWVGFETWLLSRRRWWDCIVPDYDDCYLRYANHAAQATRKHRRAGWATVCGLRIKRAPLSAPDERRVVRAPVKREVRTEAAPPKTGCLRFDACREARSQPSPRRDRRLAQRSTPLECPGNRRCRLDSKTLHPKWGRCSRPGTLPHSTPSRRGGQQCGWLESTQAPPLPANGLPQQVAPTG
jgi:hypothetical protein